MQLLGDRKLVKQFEELQKPSTIRRIGQAGLNQAAKVGVRGIKTRIPSEDKGVRKAIRWRALRVRESVDAAVKFGAVGKVRTSTKVRGDRPGVGIGARNIHWWFLGTSSRFTKEGHSRGVMPPQEDSITVLAMPYAGAMKQAAKRGTWKQMKKEVAKGLKK